MQKFHELSYVPFETIHTKHQIFLKFILCWFRDHSGTIQVWLQLNYQKIWSLPLPLKKKKSVFFLHLKTFFLLSLNSATQLCTRMKYKYTNLYLYMIKWRGNKQTSAMLIVVGESKYYWHKCYFYSTLLDSRFLFFLFSYPSTVQYAQMVNFLLRHWPYLAREQDSYENGFAIWKFRLRTHFNNSWKKLQTNSRSTGQ